MKPSNRVILLFVLLLHGLCAAAYGREEISLNGAWRMQYTADTKMPEGGEWSEMEIPSHILQKKELPHAWFQRSFVPPKTMAGKHIYLRFMAVKFVSEVFLNGKKVGGHYGGWEPFELCITDACKVGERNDLLVRASDVRSVIAEELDEEKLKPDMEFYQLAHDSIMAPIGSGWRVFGLWQDVSLVAYDDVRIADVFVRTSVRKKEIGVDITAENLTDQKQAIRLGVRVFDGDNVAMEMGEKESDLGPHATQTLTLSRPWDSPKLWSHHSPHLYYMAATLSAGDKTADDLRVRFGFREFWTEGIHLVLNGTRINFLATAGHPPPNSTKEDAKKLYAQVREGNCVAIRLHANIWPEWWYEAADEVGMPVIQESAFFCWSRNYALTKDKFWDNYRDHLKAMILRDRNHPSIVMYSLENEILSLCEAEKIPPTLKRLAEMGRFVKGLDPTRPIMYDSDEDPEGVADVVNLHYPHGFRKWHLYPDTAYWLDTPTQLDGYPRTVWKWDRKKPLYFGEFFISGQGIQTCDPYTLFLGDDAYHDYGVSQELTQAHGWRYLIEGYRAQDMAGMCPWTVIRWGGACMPTDAPPFQACKRAYHPNAAFLREHDSRFYGGETVERTVFLYNDTFESSDLTLRWMLAEGEKVIQSDARTFSAAPAERTRTTIPLKMPEVTERTLLKFKLSVKRGGKVVFEETRDYCAFPRRKLQVQPGAKIALYRADVLARLLKDTGTSYAELRDLSDPLETNVLIIGPNALQGVRGEEDMPVVGDDASPAGKLAAFTRQGGTVIVLEQDAYPSGLLPASLTERACTIAFKRSDEALVFKGANESDFRMWRGDHLVCRRTIAKPTSGSFRTLVDSGGDDGLTYLPLLEIRNGKGRYLLSQLLLAEKMGREPVAQIMVENLINYGAGAEASQTRLGVVQDKMPLKEFMGEIGALFDDLSGKLAGADLSQFDVLVLECDSPEVAGNQALLRRFAERGGKVLLHAGTPEEVAKLQSLLPETVPLQRSNVVPVTIAAKDAVIDGLTNQDTQWLGSRKGLGWRTQTPLSAEIIDYAVVGTLPRPEECQTVEAEGMRPDRGPQPTLTETDVRMGTNGSIAAAVSFAETAEYMFGIRGKGTPFAGIYPQIMLRIDDKAQGGVTLDGEEWGTYTLSTPVSAGRHKIALAFVNDAWSPATREDRNAVLDRLVYAKAPVVNCKKLLSPAALVKLPCGKGFFLIDQINWHKDVISSERAQRYLCNILGNLGVRFQEVAGGVTIPGAAFAAEQGEMRTPEGTTIASLWANATIATKLRSLSDREYTFSVAARGTPAAGEFPNVRLAANEKPVGDQMLSRHGWQLLRFKTRLGKGDHKISLAFTNDLYQPPEDRNLEIAHMEVR